MKTNESGGDDVDESEMRKHSKMAAQNTVKNGAVREEKENQRNNLKKNGEGKAFVNSEELSWEEEGKKTLEKERKDSVKKKRRQW